MSNDNVLSTKKALSDALGDNTKMYFDHMKLWFKMKVTKEEFDREARALLPPDQVYLHNAFFLAILTKVEGLPEVSHTVERSSHSSHSHTHSHSRTGSNNKKHKHRSTSEKCSFDPVDVVDYVAPGSPPRAGSDAQRLAAQELFLPDHALVMGRFMISAWEQGLEGAEDDTVDLVVAAVHVFLKNILTAVITQRKGYKTRDDFIYDIGCDVPNMWLRNTANIVDPMQRCPTEMDENSENVVPACPPTIDEMEQATAFNMACSVPQLNNRRDRVTIQEVYETLKVRKNIVANHSVYAVNMEKIATLLSHPSY